MLLLLFMTHFDADAADDADANAAYDADADTNDELYLPTGLNRF